LALAVLCLREVAEDQRDETLVDGVTGEALDLWLEHFGRHTTAALTHLTGTLPALGDLNGRYRGIRLLTWLPTLEPIMALVSLVEAIGSTAATAEVLGRLVELIRDREDDVRESAAEAL